jgi:hypothetical protein
MPHSRSAAAIATRHTSRMLGPNPMRIATFQGPGGVSNDVGERALHAAEVEEAGG